MVYYETQMILRICSYLGPKELCNISFTCHELRRLCINEEALWSHVFQETWPRIHAALVIQPVKWKFSSRESRVFVYFMSIVPPPKTETKFWHFWHACVSLKTNRNVVSEHIQTRRSSPKRKSSITRHMNNNNINNSKHEKHKNNSNKRKTEGNNGAITNQDHKNKFGLTNRPQIKTNRNHNKPEMVTKERTRNEKNIDLTESHFEAIPLPFGTYFNKETCDLAFKMKIFQKNLLFQKAAIYIIRRLCYYTEDSPMELKDEVENNVRLFGFHEIVTVILNDIKMALKSDPELVAWAFCALGNLSTEDNKNAQLLVSQRGIDLILKILKKYHTHEDVVYYGCFLLKNLAVISKFYEQQIVEKNGIPRILSLLYHNQNSVKVVRRCLSLLWVVTKEFRIVSDKKIPKAILQVSRLLCQIHRTSPKIIVTVFQCLRNLVEINEEVYKLLIEHKTKDVILELMTLHSNHLNLSLEGNMLLFSVFTRTKPSETLNEHQQILLTVADNILSKMWDHPNHVIVNQFGVEILANFSLRGGIFAAHLQNRGIVELLTRLISNKKLLFTNEPNWSLKMKYILAHQRADV